MTTTPLSPASGGAPAPAGAPAGSVDLRRAGARAPRAGRVRGGRGSRLKHVVLVVTCAAWLVPALGLLVASFRTAADTNADGWWSALVPPWGFTLDNYATVLDQGGVWGSFLNSFYITVPATVLVTFVAGFAAYAFAWMRFPGRDAVFMIIVALLVVPLQVTLVPVLGLFRDADLFGYQVSGSFLAVWLAHTGYGLPFAVYLLRNFMGGLPKDVFEAAAIDGAGHAAMFFRIVVPMSVPAFASLVIFQFLWVWNDLLVALVFIGPVPRNHPLPVTLANLTTNFGGDWQLVTAAAFVSMAVPLVVFLLLQRYFVQGVTGGAVKG